MGREDSWEKIVGGCWSLRPQSHGVVSGLHPLLTARIASENEDVGFQQIDTTSPDGGMLLIGVDVRSVLQRLLHRLAGLR